MRDSGASPFRQQLLIYPVTDLRMAHASYQDCGEGFLLTTALMRWYKDLYLSNNSNVLDWKVSPLLANSHVGLPPTHIITCGLDPLQDEGRAYADKLERAGVAVTRSHYPRQIHGFLFFGRLLSSVAPALEGISQVLRTALRCESSYCEASR
jgi:acetyl esterase